jgi:hypothetical protein
MTTTMEATRAARWHVEASTPNGWVTVYLGPHMRTAINSVRDHDETRVSYLYGIWMELT